ncbi:MAG: FkbM family methyltransferase [Hyphomicrobium sp.]|nr:FkbM family methyltransferase [Hyphomicrobium sp.]
MRQDIVHSGAPLFGKFEHGALELLRFQEPGLIVDVGAAAGYVTKWMLHFSPGSRARCFEPFPGNWKYIDDVLGKDKRAEIRREAVSSSKGTMSFHVESVVPEGQRFSGYSSLGKLVDGSPKGSVQVPVTTLDDQISEAVRFLKIDVQDGELNVLRGATETLERGVDVAFVEFGGEIDLLDFLMERFVVFDHRYHIRPYVEGASLSSWKDLQSFQLSTGHSAFHGWPDEHLSDPKAFANFFRDERKRGVTVYTDLVCIRPGATEALLAKASAYTQLTASSM